MTTSTRPVNLDTYNLSLLTAKEDILNPRSSTNWALFAYDGVTNKLKLADSGAGGVAELVGKFHISKPQYGLCKLGSGEPGGLRIAMISWVGQNVDDFRRTECAGHIPPIKSFFKEAHVFVSAEKVEDVTEEKIRAELSKTQAHAPAQWTRRSSKSADKEALVGTNYRKTNAAMEMRLINRDSFWARAEREEEERKEDERKRMLEERRRLEKERVMKERRDAEERDKKMDEKLRMFEEQRRKRAEQEEELRRKEKFKWEVQQREHEDDMRARLRRSESIEMAAEAAALVSQRTMNPREFFRQLSSSSSQSPTSPGSSRTGKPFRRYQRSLTDTAFIFSKTEDSSASSPRTSPLVSPFSRYPPSPFNRSASPPDFRPSPASPPPSPLRPLPPVSALPGVLPSDKRAGAKAAAAAPTEPSAPPASPSLLASTPASCLIKRESSEPGALPPSPPNTPNQPEDSAFCFEPLAQPIKDLGAASHAELVSDNAYKVQAVLVEEDEEEEEEEKEEEAHQEVQKDVREQEEEELEKKPEEKEKKEEEEEDEGLELDVESAAQEEEEEEEEVKKDDQEIESPVPGPWKESAVMDADREEIRHDAFNPITNEMTNGDDAPGHNGTDGSLSPSDTELSSPELPVCFHHHGTTEEEEEEEDGVTEKNGEEVLNERQLCVRALYDYQAEDESEISFEPGDIIRDVETVDKAWWRGWSKDGRQGLFPANYVETI